MILNRFRKKDARNILKIVLENREENQYYVEVFSSSVGTMELVDGNRIGFDVLKQAIHFYYWLQEAPMFRKIDRRYHWIMKRTKTGFNDALVFLYGVMLSKDNIYFGELVTEFQHQRAMRLVNEAIPKLRDVEFHVCSFNKIIRFLPKNKCIIYVDLAYRVNVTSIFNLDVKKLYKWVKVMTELGHSVFVLDFEVKDDFDVLYESEYKTNGKSAKLMVWKNGKSKN